MAEHDAREDFRDQHSFPINLGPHVKPPALNPDGSLAKTHVALSAEDEPKE